MASPFFSRLLLCLCLLAWPVTALADPEEQVPQWTRDGQLNLTHEWIEHGGARLYWNSLLTPRQVRLVGMRFKDPADRPFLLLDEEAAKKPSAARSRRAGQRGRHARRSRAQSPKPEKKPAHTSAKLDVKRDKPASAGRRQGGLAPLKPVPPVGVPLQ
ncbi:MAG: hypothetical protein J5846_01510 [Desulfovibrio sp.]|nr:hypothetical protein [Desulfovibrio sp.]